MAVPWGKTHNERLTYGPNFFIFKFTVILKPSEVLIDDDKFFPTSNSGGNVKYLYSYLYNDDFAGKSNIGFNHWILIKLPT